MQRINAEGFHVSDSPAIPNVCAWPNLTLLADGTVLAAIFNQPCHGKWVGDLDAWVSTDRGHTWTFRSTIAPHEAADENRMNCAVGFAANGDLVILCSGWAGRTPRGQAYKPFDRSLILAARVYRSSDLGKTWQAGEKLPFVAVPFGDIHRVGDRLLTTAYKTRADQNLTSIMIESRDDGVTWREASTIAELGDETSLLPLSDTHLLASVRHNGIRLAVSHDAGATWQDDQMLTLPMQLTSNLIRLSDGSILLSYGNRNMNNFGVDARYSQDNGKTWSAPFRMADAPMRDCGYPSTVQLDDNELLTAYYTQLPGEYQYEMRTVKTRKFWS